MPTFRLTYFDAPGRAEPIRVAMFLAKLPFEDRRLKFPEFMALKEQGAFPLGTVPMLEIDGRPIVQTGAILRYIARQGAPAMYPSDPFAGLLVDSVIDTLNDTVSHAMRPSLFERDVAKKIEMRKVLLDGALGAALRYIEGAIGDGPFLTGTELTIADLVVGDTYRQYKSGSIDGLSVDALASYPKIVRLGEAYLAHPGLVAYAAR